jgi:hypothetical protein
MSLRGALVFSRSSLPTTGVAYHFVAHVVGKNKNPPRNDILYTERTFRLDRIIEFMVEEQK